MLPAPPRLAPALWMWSDPASRAALTSGRLHLILRAYRRANGMSLAAMSELTGYDASYLGHIENERRVIADIGMLRYLAAALALPAHLLGVTDPDHGDFAGLVQFGGSVIRLAEKVRQRGDVVAAVNELWPMAVRLEARAAAGQLETDTLRLLAQTRMALGVSLGTVLPEQRLATAAAWTGKALTLIRHLDDGHLLAQGLRMHGNELRKAGRLRAATARLEQAIAVSASPAGRGHALALQARAAAEHGHGGVFAEAVRHCRALLDANPGDGMITPFSLREIEARGLLALGWPRESLRVLTTDTGESPAPQWAVIDRVTTGEILGAIGEHDAAATTLRDAIDLAERHRLPHQLQRAIRAADRGDHPDISGHGSEALDRLHRQLAPEL
ncbi:helix-turn-helix domain-containing protein [Amycolatopsis magusensis]|uniref:helix-turn-helix domain-containing protein n=1 Tax=Amycolatopsis magusensis TaxID=882444 RepID=UPI0037A88FF3